VTERLLSGWPYRALLLSILAAVGGYLAFSVWGGWRDVLLALEKVGIIGLLLALSMSLLNYGLRFLRWQMYLGTMHHHIPWRPSGRIYLAGFALTTTPGKAGEALRGVLLKKHGVPWPDSFAAFISERLSDLIAIVLLTLLGFTLYPQGQLVVLIGLGAVFGGLFVLSQQRILLALYQRSGQIPHRLMQLFHHILEILLQARRCHHPRLLLVATLLSVIAWAAEALAFMWILQWMGMEVDFAFAAFVYALAMLAGALSFMPGGLGGAEGAMLALLLLRGMPLPDAIAATVLIRFTTLWFAVLLGLAALGMSRQEGSRT
jgi:uncharacterized protein (TIRG00374 family)